MLLSIVTVTYNCSDSIRKTLSSVIDAKSNFPDVEYIVIDGASTDGTCEIIKEYSDYIEHFVSEPDNGIYNAMNQGIELSNGKWVIFLNDGDEVVDLEKLVNFFRSNKTDTLDLVAFNVELSDGRIFIPEFNWKIKIRNTLHHQGLCYRRNDFLKFDESYRVFSDFDLNQKCYLSKKVIKILDFTATFHSLNGISNNKGVSKELFKVIELNFGMFFCSLSFIYFKLEGIKCRLKKFFS